MGLRYRIAALLSRRDELRDELLQNNKSTYQVMSPPPPLLPDSGFKEVNFRLAKLFIIEIFDFNNFISSG